MLKQIIGGYTGAINAIAQTFTGVKTFTDGIIANVTGTSSKATNIVGGAVGSVPYQSAADTTALLAANSTATLKALHSVSNSAPSWIQNTVAECSDYESGTWTPVDASGAGLTFVAVSARYIKIGNMVRIWAYFFYPVQSDPTTAKIGGLPFTIGNFDANIGGVGGSSNNATFGRAYYLNKNATTAQPVTASMGPVTNANMSDVACAIGLTYLIS